MNLRVLETMANRERRCLVTARTTPAPLGGDDEPLVVYPLTEPEPVLHGS
jgi:hypothetical protein